jgi:HEAT repeat protein
MPMGLIELCLLSCLSPQEPEPSTEPPAETTAPASEGEGEAEPVVSEAEPVVSEFEPLAPADYAADDAARLRAAEAAGDEADGTVLLDLTQSSDATIAARAAWLLGNSKNQQHHLLLDQVVTKSQHADARLHALQALRNAGAVGSTTFAIRALTDDDRRVRTIAAQLLGKLRRPAAVEPPRRCF